MINLLALLSPFLVLPLLVGIYLLIRSTSSPLNFFLGLMTLKPLIATPLWLYILGSFIFRPSYQTTILDVVRQALPGISLTLLILLICRTKLKGQSIFLIMALLILDTLRWGSSVLIFTPFFLRDGASETNGTSWLSLVSLSLSMPSIFAIVALVFSVGLDLASRNR